MVIPLDKPDHLVLAPNGPFRNKKAVPVVVFIAKSTAFKRLRGSAWCSDRKLLAPLTIFIVDPANDTKVLVHKSHTFGQSVASLWIGLDHVKFWEHKRVSDKVPSCAVYCAIKPVAETNTLALSLMSEKAEY